MASIFEKKKCKSCGFEYPVERFVRTNSRFIDGNSSPICVGCLERKMNLEDMNSVDEFCRWANIPFIPDEWIRIYRDNPNEVLVIYTDVMVNGEYAANDWKTVNDFWMAEIDKGTLFDNIEEVKREFVNRMKMKWQMAATYPEFVWLETYYDKMSKMQNLKNPATKDILQKICKIALQVDRVLNDSEAEVKQIKDLTGIYNTMLKTSGFLEDGVSNANTIDSVAKLYQLMEKHNFQPTFYDGKAKDYADSTIDDIKKTMSRLIRSDSSISEILEAKLRGANLPKETEDLDETEIGELDTSVLKEIQRDRQHKQATNVNGGDIWGFGGK